MVTAVVLLAAAYLVIRTYRQIRPARDKKAGECPGCGTCEAGKAAEPSER